jgi:hypothetical protein
MWGSSKMLIQRPIVDRQTELARFTELLDSGANPATSILLVNDESGQGKSSLLKVFNDHCQVGGIPTAHIDLKGGSLTPIDILRTVLTDLRPLTLNRCSSLLNNPHSSHSPPIQIRDNTGIGTTDTYIQATSSSIEEQKQWWASGAQALLDDFSEISKSAPKRFVLIFDTYEKASPETKDWISNHLLRMATPRRVSCLCIVLAGKETPSPTSEWEHYYQMLDLEPLQLEHWLDYAKLVRADVASEQIELVYRKYKHQPLKMAEWIWALST